MSNECPPDVSRTFILCPSEQACDPWSSHFDVELNPNPALDYVNIKVVSLHPDVNFPSELSRVQLLDFNGDILKDIDTGGIEFLMETSTLLNGLYFIKAFIGEEIIIKQVSIEK